MHWANYRYNAFGQRVTKTLYGRNEGTARTLNFAYTPEGWLLSEIGRKQDKARLFTDEYIWLGGRPLAKLTRKINANGVTKKAEVSYLHTDHLATPRRATNDNGQTVWQWNSDAYGAKRADRDPDGDGIKTHVRLRFPGQYYDGESGLHYNHHRDYDPKLGRYIQSDPIGLWGGINRYAYVGGNPVNWIDPMGLTRYSRCRGTWNGVACRLKGGGGATVVTLKTTVINPELFRWTPPFGGGGGGGLPRPHRYKQEVTTTCSADEAFELIRGAGNSAPGAPYARAGTHLITLTGNNPITQTVDVVARTITNVTNVGHIFHPGQVRITVTGDGDYSSVTVEGFGIGGLPTLNNLLGALLFGTTLQDIEDYCSGT